MKLMTGWYDHWSYDGSKIRVSPVKIYSPQTSNAHTLIDESPSVSVVLQAFYVVSFVFWTTRHTHGVYLGWLIRTIHI